MSDDKEKRSWITNKCWLLARAVRNRVRRSRIFRWWRNPETPRGIVVLAIVAAGLVAARVTFRHHPETVATDLLADVANAVVVSLLLTVSADRYLRRRFFLEATGELLWALLSDDAPREHRAAVEAIAREKTIYRSTEWDIRIDPIRADIGAPVRLTISVVTQGMCHQFGGYRPSGKRYLLASTTGYESEYLRYRLDGEWRGEPRQQPVLVSAEMDGDDNIGAISRYVTKEDGHILVDEDQIAEAFFGDATLRSDAPFRIERQTRIVRQDRGFLPLVTVHPSIRSSIVVKTPREVPFEITVMEAISGEVRPLQPGVAATSGYSGPGSTMILRWRRLDNR
jgi:hypothetical protein